MDYVDLHCHVLPRLDDGPRRIEGAITMLHVLEAEGVGTVVATPHLRADYPDVVPAELAGRCLELEGRAAADGAAVAIEPGGELELEWASHASPAQLRDVSLGGRGSDLLIETPHATLPLDFEDRVLAFVRAGYRVTLAHPEVSADLQFQPQRIDTLVRAGVLMQVTAGALLRPERKSRSAALARRLVADGRAHVIATAAHSAGPWRPPELRRALLQAARLAGARAEWMVSEAPAAILAGEPLPAAPVTPVTPRGLARLRRAAGG